MCEATRIMRAATQIMTAMGRCCAHRFKRFEWGVVKGAKYGWLWPGKVLLVLCVVVLTSGCGNKGTESKTPGQGTAQPPPKDISAETVLAAFKQGDRTAAVEKFVRVDWTRRPLFAADSVLNLSEGTAQGEHSYHSAVQQIGCGADQQGGKGTVGKVDE